MEIFSIDFVLFTLGGYSVSLLELIAVLFGLTSVFLAGRGKSYNFWFGYVYAILLFFLFLQKHLYSSMLLQPISVAINIFGHYRWTHPKKDENNKNRELKVTLLKKKQGVIFIGIASLFALLWGTAMLGLGDAFPNIFPAHRPYLDASVMALMLLAQYLSAQKKLECWGVWLAVNTTNIILYLSAGMIFMPIVSASYLVLAVFGFISWRKQWRNQQ